METKTKTGEAIAVVYDECSHRIESFAYGIVIWTLGRDERSELIRTEGGFGRYTELRKTERPSLGIFYHLVDRQGRGEE